MRPVECVVHGQDCPSAILPFVRSMISIRPCLHRQRRHLSQFLLRGPAHRLYGQAIQDRDDVSCQRCAFRPFREVILPDSPLESFTDGLHRRFP
jgi:hypothetical protein